LVSVKEGAVDEKKPPMTVMIWLQLLGSVILWMSSVDADIYFMTVSGLDSGLGVSIKV
jgi:hypothetical protein